MSPQAREWTPASTKVCFNQLSTPSTRVELGMIAVYRKPAQGRAQDVNTSLSSGDSGKHPISTNRRE
jgi:hypothetical protein